MNKTIFVLVLFFISSYLNADSLSLKMQNRQVIEEKIVGIETSIETQGLQEVELLRLRKKLSSEIQVINKEYKVIEELMELNTEYASVLTQTLKKKIDILSQLHDVKNSLVKNKDEQIRLQKTLKIALAKLQNNNEKIIILKKNFVDKERNKLILKNYKQQKISLTHIEICGLEESPNKCKKRAIITAKRKALEQGNIEIVSKTQVDNFIVSEDFILSKAQSLLSHIILITNIKVGQNNALLWEVKLDANISPKISQQKMKEINLIALDKLSDKENQSSIKKNLTILTNRKINQKYNQQKTPINVITFVKAKSLVVTAKTVNEQKKYTPTFDYKIKASKTIAYIEPQMVVLKLGAELKLAVGINEVTIAEYEKFIDETNYKTEAYHTGSCREYRGITKKRQGLDYLKPGYSVNSKYPAVCISYFDAKKYSQWLAKKTGKNYRLPNAAEWSAFSLSSEMNNIEKEKGAHINCLYANIRDRSFGKHFGNSNTYEINSEPCNDRYIYPTEVKKFLPNSFGLYDIHGNVREWTSECLDEEIKNLYYCNHLIIKGNSAYYRMTADRTTRGGPDAVSNDVGFRLVYDVSSG
ncbi:MAG: hypothetical protein COB35_05340 [Gammaproteobacteria bacterium]|nr:MAG: hypothetical protein COB35_05340 [Gammaproteobacteria bacterium]